MPVPDASVGCLLKNVTQILSYNYHLGADVRENIENLKAQLLNLQSLLEESYYCDSDSKLMEIRQILDEAEDAVDSYILLATYGKLQDVWVRKRYRDYAEYPGVIRKVSKDIAAISAKVQQFNQDNVVMPGLQHQKITILDPSHEALQVEGKCVIGFEEAAGEVRKLLLEGNEHLEVVSVVGMLGLGKTTLAKKVYKDLDVSCEYMVKAFVYVSQECDKREVLLQILSSSSKSNEEVKSMNEEQLEKHVYKVLEGKQYLVVLDDVWKKKDWDGLKGAFPNNKIRCRVLITTQNTEVAKHANQSPNSLHRLHFLPLDESRKLLRWKVFQQDNITEVHKELERYEIEIATKCNGLPLAIVVIAGILVNHPDRADWWNDVANNMKGYIAKGVKQTTMVIELMYQHLPNYLKPCFLYLGVFHRDSEILVWKLVRLWISEGFIPQERGINLEDSAERYLKDLIRRNLVIVGKMRKDGRIKTCRMHDTLREFCKKEAAKGNIFQEIKENNLNKFLRDEPALDQYRRLCDNGTNISKYISRTRRGKHVRSFLSFVKEGTYADGELFPTIPRAFKLMKVLEIQSLVFTRFPPDICYLVLLKYLSMSSTFSTLPHAMSNLWFLQTLIVTTTSPTLQIRASLQKMPQFRHLHSNASVTLSDFSFSSHRKMPPSQLSVNTVQTLCTISTESCTPEVFDWAPKVKKLGICGTLAKIFEVNDGGCSFLPQFYRLEELENLKLLNDDTSPPLCCLPKQFPGRLTKLTLMNTRLEWKEMSKLGELESLEVLKLKEYGVLISGKIVEPGKGRFSASHAFVCGGD